MTARRDKWIVVTTINRPTRAIEVIAKLCQEGWSAVVVGDRKTPSDWNASGIEFLSVDEQRRTFGPISDELPYNHYCRKNLGYLYAIRQGARIILETDDDNIPYPSFGRQIEPKLTTRDVSGATWINVYKYFTDAHIWPRGLPLDEIASIGRIRPGSAERTYPVQQFLADGDPDVDAVYRLVCYNEITFDPRAEPVGLESGSWVPFNSQNTLFFDQAFPLLYLPCLVSFRMTDIWRSFVAQAALWAHGHRLAFRTSTVEQVRNEHNLMRDFRDEVPGYLENKRIIDILDECVSTLKTPSDMTATVRTLWQALHRNGIIPDRELVLADLWLDELARATATA